MRSFSSSPMDSGGSWPPRSEWAAYDSEADDEDKDEDGKLVLVIDDSPLICRIVKFTLEHYGINTMIFYSGVEALSALEEGSAPIPDLILLDIGMPVMNGYAVASLLRDHKELRALPIVMLSGHDGIFDRFRARRVGADDFISKPFERHELVSKVFSLLNLPLPDDILDPQV